METNRLCQLIISSEQRRKILVYLEEKPGTIAELRFRFAISTVHLSARLRELAEHDLVAVDNKTYTLTTRGRVLLDSYRPYADTVEVIDKFGSYWNSHDMSHIPRVFLSRIGELRHARYVEDDIEDMNRTRNLLMEIVGSAGHIRCVSPMFDETIVAGLIQICILGVPVSVVLDRETYSKLKSEYREMAARIERCDNFEIYVADCEAMTPFILTDAYLYFSMFYKNGKFDVNSNLVSQDEAAKRWGLDLFNYYKARSVKS